MKLYFSPGVCSLSPHIALVEAGLDFSLERVDMSTKLTASGADFRAINSKGYVPALELDDGTVLTEGPAIVQYIADLAPQAKLMGPVGSIERYLVASWLNFIATELHKNFNPLFNPANGEEVKAAARANLSNRLTWLAGQLEGRDYLMGSQFSAADGYLFAVLGWAGLVKFSLADWPVFAAYSARVAARPAVQQALRNEGLLK